MALKLHNTQSIRKILVCRPDRLGDVILTLPAVYSLHETYPEATIYYLCKGYTSEILRSYSIISDLIIYDKYIKDKSIKSISQLTHAIKTHNFDLAIHFLPRFPSAVATFLANIKVILGTGFRWYSFLYTHRQYEHRKYNLHHEADYNLRLLSRIGVKAVRDKKVFGYFSFSEELQNTSKKLISESFDGQPYILIHPGSGGSSIDWPLDHFINLIRLLNQWGKYKIGITGIQSERNLFDKFYRADIHFIDLIGRLNLNQLALLSKHASLFIANSTGPLHLAVAMGTPVLGLYPDQPGLGPLRWGPWQQASLYHLTPSSVTSRSDSGPKMQESMSYITAQHAFERLKQILSD